jgi:hypothetical protein
MTGRGSELREAVRGAGSLRRAELIKFAWQAAAITAVATVMVYAASKTTTYTDLESTTYDFTVLSGSDKSV